jgi:hypothetical protein
MTMQYPAACHTATRTMSQGVHHHGKHVGQEEDRAQHVLGLDPGIQRERQHEGQQVSQRDRHEGEEGGESHDAQVQLPGTPFFRQQQLEAPQLVRGRGCALQGAAAASSAPFLTSSRFHARLLKHKTDLVDAQVKNKKLSLGSSIRKSDSSPEKKEASRKGNLFDKRISFPHLSFQKASALSNS